MRSAINDLFALGATGLTGSEHETQLFRAPFHGHLNTELLGKTCDTAKHGE
jgi:hypothetical protein